MYFVVFFFKQKTAYEMRISDWSSDVCSSDLRWKPHRGRCLGEVCRFRLGIVEGNHSDLIVEGDVDCDHTVDRRQGLTDDVGAGSAGHSLDVKSDRPLCGLRGRGRHQTAK